MILLAAAVAVAACDSEPSTREENLLDSAQVLAPNQVAPFERPLPNRAFLGLRVQPMTVETKAQFGLKANAGIVVLEVTEGGPGYSAGIVPGDIVTTVDGRQVKTLADLQAAVASAPADQPVDVRISRSGRTQNARTQ